LAEFIRTRDASHAQHGLRLVSVITGCDHFFWRGDIVKEAKMGLLDVLNGMQNGPRGAPVPGAGGSGGMSPITMAILGLLAYKAVKGFGQSGAAPAAPKSGPIGAGMGGGGGLGNILSGGLGSLLAGGAAGSVLSGGLGDLVRQMQQGGQGAAANSWVGNGPNQAISPGDLAGALGADRINSLMSQTGMSRDELLSGLAQQLPDAVNELTPDGRLPTDQEMAQRVG
jgi:uncharacterized protein YidB (DUF937 family)